MTKIPQPQKAAPCFNLLLATNNQRQFCVIIRQEKQIVTIVMITGKNLLKRCNLKQDVLM